MIVRGEMLYIQRSPIRTVEGNLGIPNKFPCRLIDIFAESGSYKQKLKVAPDTY